MKWRQSYKAWDEGSQRWKPYSEIYDTPFWPSHLRGDYSHINITPADDEAKAYQDDIDEYVRLAKIYDTYAEKPHDWLAEELRDISGHYKTPEETKEFLEALRKFITPEMLQQEAKDKKKKGIIIVKEKGPRDQAEEERKRLLDEQLERGAKEAWETAPDDFAERYRIISDAVQGVM